MSKSWAVNYMNRLIRTLVSMSRKAIQFPRQPEQWVKMQQRFEDCHEVPFVCGPIDGTQFAVTRPKNHEGWYCRERHPVLNMQTVVDDRMRLMSFDMRPRSWSDSKIWSASYLGNHSAALLPTGCHIIGDAGYGLSSRLTPYLEHQERGSLTAMQKSYNYKHSATRMVVECAFGFLRSRFRILKRTM